MTNHPITPPQELVARWKKHWFDAKIKHIDLEDYMLAQAARWGWSQSWKTSEGELQKARDEESDAFAIVQMRLEDLAGDQELMIYHWPKAGDWDIQHTNPSLSVQLGEVNGKYSCVGTTLEEAVRKLANALPIPDEQG